MVEGDGDGEWGPGKVGQKFRSLTTRGTRKKVHRGLGWGEKGLGLGTGSPVVGDRGFKTFPGRDERGGFGRGRVHRTLVVSHLQSPSRGHVR